MTGIQQQWIDRLRAPDAAARLEAARVIGTLDEVAAYDVLSAQFRAEPDAEAKQAMMWAGKRLHTARQAGFSTLEAIIDHFQVTLEIAAPPASGGDEAKLRQIKFEMEVRALREQEKSTGRKTLTNIAGAAFIGGLPGLMMMRPTSEPLADENIAASFGLHAAARPQRRKPAPPSDTDIRAFVHRLRTDEKNEKRINAARDLAAVVNNPAALPHLARAFIEDHYLPVQQAAQEAAKLLYWNAIYWEMEQDGAMTAEIERRRAALGLQADADAAGTAGQPSAPTPPAAESKPAPAQDDVGDILRKAEEARRKRMKR